MIPFFFVVDDLRRSRILNLGSMLSHESRPQSSLLLFILICSHPIYIPASVLINSLSFYSQAICIEPMKYRGIQSLDRTDRTMG